jgi:hypothetical protein
VSHQIVEGSRTPGIGRDKHLLFNPHHSNCPDRFRPIAVGGLAAVCLLLARLPKSGRTAIGQNLTVEHRPNRPAPVVSHSRTVPLSAPCVAAATRSLSWRRRGTVAVPWPKLTHRRQHVLDGLQRAAKISERGSLNAEARAIDNQRHVGLRESTRVAYRAHRRWGDT